MSIYVCVCCPKNEILYLHNCKVSLWFWSCARFHTAAYSTRNDELMTLHTTYTIYGQLTNSYASSPENKKKLSAPSGTKREKFILISFLVYARCMALFLFCLCSRVCMWIFTCFTSAMKLIYKMEKNNNFMHITTPNRILLFYFWERLINESRSNESECRCYLAAVVYSTRDCIYIKRQQI